MAIKKAKTLLELLTLALSTGVYINYTRKSIQWLRSSASNLTKITTPQVMREASDVDSNLRANIVNRIILGNLYLYNYDPKLKKTLPYYDIYPVVFPIKHYKDGFLGINMHYLPPKLRATLLDKLYDTINNTNYNYQTRLKITYDILASASKYKLFRPCVKRYLYTHVKGTRYLHIHPKNWEIILFLPNLASWRKANQEKVWSDSRKIISKY